MKRAIEIVIFFSIFSLAFLPGKVFGFTSPCTNPGLLPPFIATGVSPNILIILDDSQSMEDDFNGNVVGSYDASSKSAIILQALHNVMTEYDSKASVGLMTYSLSSGLQLQLVGSVESWYSPTESSGNPQGYLNDAAGSLTGASQILTPAADSTTYKSCGANGCSFIVNASGKPTAGVLQTALSYFNGQYSGQSSPINAVCQKNYIIYITDGAPTTMLNGSVSSDPSTTMPQVLAGLEELDGQSPPQTLPLGLTSWKNVTHTFTGNANGNGNSQTTYTFPVKTYVLGVDVSTLNKAYLDQMAAAGGTATPDGHAHYADNSSDTTSGLEAIVQGTLESIVTDLLARVAAGSSISILSNQTQTGANVLQGVFYPQKYFGTTPITWPGYLYNWWFYNSPDYQNIREDTTHVITEGNPDDILDLTGDYGLSFLFDPQNGLSVSRYSDPNGTGNSTQFVDNVGLDSLTPIWEAGKMLWETSPDSRTVYTPGNNSNGSGLVPFTTSDSTLTTAPSPLGDPTNFTACLQGTSGSATLQNLVSYVRGADIPGCRSRTVGLCSDSTGNISNTPCSNDTDCSILGYATCNQNTWKLGDIVYSSPKVKADYKYCASVDSIGNASFTSQACVQDSDCPTGNTCLKKESVVFVGANDGMLHAFQTGVLTTYGLDTSQSQVDKLTGIPTSDMGKELWAFIPQNVLPYLRCLATNNCHLYYNDLSPYVTTMYVHTTDSSGNPVTEAKTVLIGGMRLGGGSETLGASSNYCFNSAGVSDGATCNNNTNNCPSGYTSSCSAAFPTNVPSDTCPGGVVACSDPATCYNPSSCIGLSSYYALDITDVEHPKLLWEFSDPFLGYSYSGPAVIHEWSDSTNKTGDQYFVMFLSGPTEADDGSSLQNIHAFVLTLNAKLGISSVYHNDFGLSTKNGFGGRLFTNGLDVDGDGYTDYVFFGYASSPNGKTGSWAGGIGKVDTTGNQPSAWNYDVTTYDNIPQVPITAQVATEKCFNTWYIYAGSGRYFMPLDSYGSSGNSSYNFLIGVPFCAPYNNYCGQGSNHTNINNVNPSNNACTDLTTSQNLAGAYWMLDLDAGVSPNLPERLVTDPTVSPNNTIYFTTSEPTSDPCGYGGQSRVWGLNCATGGAIASSCGSYTVTEYSGTLYLQTSTGAINKISPASSFTSNSNKTTQWYTGMPPEDAPPVVNPAAPGSSNGQLIQWIEK